MVLAVVVAVAVPPVAAAAAAAVVAAAAAATVTAACTQPQPERCTQPKGKKPEAKCEPGGFATAPARRCVVIRMLSPTQNSHPTDAEHRNDENPSFTATIFLSRRQIPG